MGRYILFFFIAASFGLLLWACGSSAGNGGGGGSAAPGAVTVTGTSLDNLGRRIVGGCLLPGGLECYEYSRKTPYKDNELTYFLTNCTASLGGTWDAQGCALASPMGYCETLIMHGLYVRHYISSSHSTPLATHISVCDGDNGLWW